MNKIRNYFKGVGIEARRVRWPRKKVLWNAVAVVTIITVFAAVVIFYEDWLTLRLMQGFEEAFSNEVETTSETAARIVTFIGGLL
ncbi:MAG: preprotein translocase subunit SecE [Bacilli bacterium]